MLYYLLEFGRITAGRLPAFISYPLASAVGDIVYFLWRRGRCNMIKSIAAVLHQDTTSPQVRMNARYGMRNFCKYIVDMLRYAYPRKGLFERDIDLIGTENLDRVLTEGKGAIIVGLHMGNLDLGIRALSNAGYTINAIVQNLESGQVDRFIQKPRLSSGLKLISAASGVLQILNVLKRNEAIALMIDSPGFDRGIRVKLGNKNVILSTGMAAMALRTGAGVIPCGLIRSTNTRFLGMVGKPVQFNPTGDMVKDATELTQSTIRALEEMASIFSDQWYIFHPFIKDDAASVERPFGKAGETDLASY
ncbi:MAG: lysophospholipid acyltransferase family protein [Dehalococcoidales bacterium]|nr:lysophospholipid acyltransferase family protein [Dehalococcoidales bacterium]